MTTNAPRKLVCLLALSCAGMTQALVSPRNQYRNQLSKYPHQQPINGTPDLSTSDGIANLRGGALELSPNVIHLAETIAPKLGIFSSTALYFAPAATVLLAIKNDNIGDLDPIPLAVMSVVSIAWFAYGLAARDPYVVLSNIAGCVGSMGYVFGILPLLQAKKSVLRTTQSVLLGGVTATLCLWTYLGLSGASPQKIQSFLGLFASGFFIIMAGSPLSNIAAVVATKDSSSILGALTIAQIINTILWSAYGFAVSNFFVLGPNCIGLVLGLAQLALKLLYPTKTVSSKRSK
jgi:solute carrier family 50 (sugar transporter)